MRPQHPSGKPIRADKIKRPSSWRVPLDGYVTPRLQPQNKRTEAIGFVHDFDAKDDE